MPDTVRTFVAVEISADLRKRVQRFLEELREGISGVTWVAPQNLHVTLKFLGDVEEARIDEVCRTVAEAVASCAPFDLQVRGVGAFPRIERPQTLWLGLAAGREQLVELYRPVNRLLHQLGFPREERQFAPHLTIGRIRDRSAEGAQLAARLRQHADRDFGSCRIDEAAIFSSVLGRGGPTYEALGHAPLAAREV